MVYDRHMLVSLTMICHNIWEDLHCNTHHSLIRTNTMIFGQEWTTLLELNATI
jgi:hypothetical protein